jgi:hypothetical protein
MKIGCILNSLEDFHHQHTAIPLRNQIQDLKLAMLEFIYKDYCTNFVNKKKRKIKPLVIPRN